MNLYIIETAEPLPSLNVDSLAFYGTYQGAVDYAHQTFLKVRRSTYVRSGHVTPAGRPIGNPSHFWHAILAVPKFQDGNFIGYAGRAEDRNTNSGVQFPSSYPHT